MPVFTGTSCQCPPLVGGNTPPPNPLAALLLRSADLLAKNVYSTDRKPFPLSVFLLLTPMQWKQFPRDAISSWILKFHSHLLKLLFYKLGTSTRYLPSPSNQIMAPTLDQRTSGLPQTRKLIPNRN